MPTATTVDLAQELEQLRSQMAEMRAQMQLLEQLGAGKIPATEVSAAVPAEPVPESITEEELLAISAAIGAFLGVRAHIKQIRLVSSNAWAQQGRVSIQASHSLQG